MIGSILGNRYRILRNIGSGGMAKVYLAEDMNEGQVVAVKVLYPHFGEDISYIQRFTREAKLASALSNQHVVKVLDYGSSRDVHYLVMEYVEGQDLRSMLNERGPLPWDQALGMVDQICEALAEANQHNIVHRDIKPQNVMITAAGILKVLDFGIARSRMLPSLTQSGFVGSPYYISPEQAMGEEVDIRSDIYSTGIVLYELLSGRVPFDAKSPWSIISQHIASAPPEIEVNDRAVPRDVQKLLQRMVAKNPDDRFQDPAVLRQAIQALLRGETLPEGLGTPPPTNMDKVAMADGLFRRAEEAMSLESWQKAVNLLNQVIDLDPKHPQALEKRTEAGTQARLLALYTAATRALEGSRWQEAIDELTEILEIAPDYKDSVKMLVKARDAVERQTSDLELSKLYDQAVAHFEAQEYPQAEELFSRIRQVSPSYRRADALWAESRRRRSRGGAFDRLNQNLAQSQNTAQKGSSFSLARYRWAALTLVAVAGIVAVIWFISLNNPRPTAANLPTEDLIQQATQALEAGDLPQARERLNTLLAADPENEQGLALQEALAAQEALDSQLTAAKAAFADRDWTAAIETLKRLNDETDFQPGTVQNLLCDAYLARGRERLERVSNARDQATVRAALADFRAGQQVCPNHQELAQQAEFAESYLGAMDEEHTAEELVTALSPIVAAEPAYAGGQARENLYLAYLRRGDQLLAQNQAEAALEAYNAALALSVADKSAAQEKQAEAMAALESTSITATAAIESSPPLTESTSSTEDVEFKYAAPILLSPEPFAEFSGQFTEIILTWQPMNLEPDEYYDVTIRHFVGDEPRYWGAPLTETRWRVPIEAGYGEASKDEFTWWVTVRQQGTDEFLSPPSEERPFIWRP